MIRGVLFKIPQLTTNTLGKIFNAVDVNRYYWCVIQSQTETWNNSLEDDLFARKCYTGEEFSKCIQSNHYIVFLKLQAYCTYSDFENISEYDAYMKSDCQLILLVYDCEYVELYSKDHSIINSVYQRAVTNAYSEIEFIIDSIDGRKKMDIL